VVQTLGIDLHDYGRSRTLQPITAFRTGVIGGLPVLTDYPATVSFGIRRSEFDHYLLERSGARLRLAEPLESLARTPQGWCINGWLHARVVVGAGGHFCPVARQLGAAIGSGEQVIAAQEIEYRLDAAQAAQCTVEPSRPELYFCDDLKGYGWCVRKGDWLNVGLGREDKRQLAAHVAAFTEWLRRERRVPADLPTRFKGHAYLLYPQAPRPLVADGILLVGDAAGLAYAQSGEGIRPAIESGILAAEVIADALHGAGGVPDAAALDGYRVAIEQRFGCRRVGRWPLPEAGPAPLWRRRLAGVLLGSRWFSRRVVIDRWFLHGQQPALPAIGQAR
jgi:flavin-dependent dehydrogenase